MRCHLHYLTGRAEERLTFDLQPRDRRAAWATPTAGVRAVERFMKHYFLVAKDVGELTRIFCAKLEERAAAQGRAVSAGRGSASASAARSAASWSRASG